MSPGLRIFNPRPTNWVVEAPIAAPMLIPDTVSNDGAEGQDTIATADANDRLCKEDAHGGDLGFHDCCQTG